MSTSNTLSVIIPVHNTSKLVRRAVESIVNQKCSYPIEILLIENGSTDNSLETIQQLQSEFHNVRAMVSDKTGPSEARNFGICHATGDFITFVDSDDYIDPDTYQTLIDAKIKYNADAVYCNYLLEYDDKRIVHKFTDTGCTRIVSNAQCAYDIIMEISTSSPCVRIFDRNFFDSRRFPEGIFYEDHDCIYRWMYECKSIVYVDTPFYHYCLRSNSTTSTFTTSKIYDYFFANYRRIDFVNSVADFTAEQRKKLIRHIIGELYHNLKTYIRIVAKNKTLNTDKNLPLLREKFLQAAESVSYISLGKKLIKVLKVKFLWHRMLARYSR